MRHEPPLPPVRSLAPIPKIKAAALSAGVFIVLSLAGLYASGGLSLKTGILAVTGPLLPVASGYMKAS